MAARPAPRLDEMRQGRRNALVEPRYGWLWVYAAVHPRTGRGCWLILPSLNGDCVQLFLDEFARAHLSEGKRIVLVWDGAPAHRAKKLRIAAGISLVNFPAYTPQLNRSERSGSPLKETIANERQTDIRELEEKAIERCQTIGSNTEAVKSMTNYHWWATLEP